MRLRLWTSLALPALAAACSHAPEPAPAPPAPPPVPAETPAPTPAPAALGAAVISYGGEMTQGGWIRGTLPNGTIKATLDGEPFPFGEDGEFFAAFDRDAGPVAKIVAVRSDGSSIESEIDISPRDWPIEHVNVARTPGGEPTEAFMKIRQPELDRIAAARDLRTGAQGWRQDFIWPVKARISGRFGSQRVYKGGEAGAYHSGMDIAGGAGTPFVAPADGVVILAAEAPFSLEGNLLMIDHGNGLNSAFLHCSEILVKVGDHVTQGQVIGKIGMTGRATGPHLHWSLKWLSARLDPLLFTGPME